jgi:hypothetical protein
LAACLCFTTWLWGLARLLQPRVRAATWVSWLIIVAVVFVTVFGALFVTGASAEESTAKTLASQTRPITIAVACCMAPGLVALLALRSAGDRGIQLD